MLEVKENYRFTFDKSINLYEYSNSVAFFQAYLDESGTHDDAKITVVSGGLARETSWSSISIQWELLLKKYEITACHANELNNFQGQFKGWDIEKRESFISKIINLIVKESVTWIGAVIKRPLFDKVKVDYPDIPLTPYSLCVDWSIISISAMSMHRKNMQPIAVLLEDGQKNNSPAFKHTCLLASNEQFRKNYKIKQISFLKKSGVIPFQVADFLAYELYKHFGGVSRYPLRKLNEKLISYGRVLTEAEIREYFAIYRQYLAGHGAKYL